MLVSMDFDNVGRETPSKVYVDCEPQNFTKHVIFQTLYRVYNGASTDFDSSPIILL